MSTNVDEQTMEEFDIFASKSSPTEEKNSFELVNSTTPTDTNLEQNETESHSNPFVPLSNMSAFLDEQVSSPLQIITQKREQEIAAKDAEEHRKMADLRQQAKEDLDRWYNEREKQIKQKRTVIQTAESDSRAKLFEKSVKHACDWSKVVQLLDFTEDKQLTKSKRDLTRMKSAIFNAKRFYEKKKLANGSDN